MRVLQINETCGTGSIGRTTYELAVELEKRGHECLVAYSHGTPKFHNCIRIGDDMDHRIHAALSRITGQQAYFSRAATRKLLVEIERFRPDIVHLRNLHSNYVNLYMLLSFLAKKDIATVITLHDCWFFTGKCTYYISANCDKWQHNCGNCPLLHVDNINPTFWFDRTKKCLSDKKNWLGKIPRLAVVGVSNWVAKEAEKSIVGDRNPIGIYNWIDLNVFHPRESNLRKKHGLEGKFVVLAVATNINKVKGFDEITWLSQHLQDNWAIVAIGKEVEKLPPNVIHISHTDDAVQLAEYYSMADVCMNTTQFETFGKVTAEAICCGTPVVVYNNTASPELVTNGCGLVIDQHRGFEAIFEALRVIEENGKGSYISNCLDAARLQFEKEIGVNKYMELYRSLIDKQSEV